MNMNQAQLQTTDGHQVTLNLINGSKCPPSGPILGLVKVMPDGSLNEVDTTPVPGPFDPKIMNRVIEVCKSQPALFAW